MDRLIYTAMTGASHVLNQQAAVSENLANASTPGFRAVLHTFRAVPLQSNSMPTRTFVVDSTAGADFSAGPMQQTGRVLDVAIPGQGWLVVQDASGKEAFTRNGSLEISTTGILQNRVGLTIVGDAGPITIPPDTEITIGRDGSISAVPSGGSPSTLVPIGRLKLVNPPTDQLERGADGLFRMRDKTDVQADVNVTVASGSLEGSNVSAVEALVNMISLGRKFEMQMKLLQNADSNARQASQILGLTS